MNTPKSHLTNLHRCVKITTVVNIYAAVAQLDRAHGYGPWCRGFESSLPHAVEQLKLLDFSYVRLELLI